MDKLCLKCRRHNIKMGERIVMTTVVAYKIAELMSKKGSIAQEDIDIYQYGFEIVLDTLLNTILLLILGIILGNPIHTIVFVVIFASVRIYAGGYHANTKLKCAVCTLFVYIVNVLVCNVEMEVVKYFVLIGYFIGNVVIAIKAPVLVAGKRLTLEGIRRNKCISILMCGLCLISVLILNSRASYYAIEIEVLIFEISILMLMQRRENANEEAKIG